MCPTTRQRPRSAKPLAGTRRVRIGTGESRLIRLGVVYADSLRLTIVTELWMREMSPSQFFEEVGGPSSEVVRRHFAKLIEYGWLRKVRTRSDGPGRPESVYRTTELAVIDEATWAEIPHSIRDAFTFQLTQQLSERLGLALEAGTLNTEHDPVFTLLSPLVLDEAGWRQGLKVLLDCFASLEMEQTDAKVRLAEQGRPPLPIVVALAAFEMPSPAAKVRQNRGLPTSTAPVDTSIPWTVRLAKVFGDPINLSILWKLNSRAMSPTQLEAAIGGASSSSFDHRCKLLLELGWLTSGPEADDGRRVMYRATSPAVLMDQLWAIIPEPLRSGDAWSTYRALCQLVYEAVKQGSFNRRVERHMTWGPLLLDEIGWQQVAKTLRKSVRAIADLERQAKRRVGTKNPPMTTTFFIAGFESPPLDSPPSWGEFIRAD